MLRKLQHILIMIRIAQVITTIYITVDMRNFQNTLMTPFPHQTPSQCRISKDVNGGGGGGGEGTDLLIPILDILHMSMFHSCRCQNCLRESTSPS